MHIRGLQQVVKLLAAVLILKVTASVILNYQDYLPPNFHSGFLQGRQSYFWNGYQWAFYPHIAAGPCALIFGILLMSERFRQRFSVWHRYLGRFQVACVLLLVTPSGMWMAFYAETGVVAALGFFSLGAVTAVCALLGWSNVVKKRFAKHRLWMSRCFLLLCSAVTLRLIGGVFTLIGFAGEWTYGLAAWISWLVPLALFEFIRLRDAPDGNDAHSVSSEAADRTSLPNTSEGRYETPNPPEAAIRPRSLRIADRSLTRQSAQPEASP